MKRLTTTVSALVIGLLLLAGLDTVAYAATGKSVIRGAVNKAVKTTTIQKTTPGPVLSLKARTGSAPLAVNSTKVVTKLNADLLDGKSAISLGVRVRSYRMPFSGTGVPAVSKTISNVPPGTYLANYDLWMYLQANRTALCWLTGPDGLVGFGRTGGDPSGYAPISGTGLMTVPSTSDVTLHCEFDAPTNVSTYDLARVNLTRVDYVAPTVLARQGARQSPPASPTSR